MKEQTGKQRKTRIIATVCAVVIVGGGAAGMLALRSRSGSQQDTKQRNAMPVSAAAADNGTISAGGTVSSGQLSDDLGLVNTNVRLTVEAVLAETGDSVTEGTELYQITEDSLVKAEKTLRSELQSAENALMQQKADAQLDESKAKILYESELLLGTTAKQDYQNGLADLDTALQQAYDDYAEAQQTVNYTPSEITAKQNERDAQQAAADSMQAEKNAAQENADRAETAYREAADNYNSIASEYNAAAAVVRYLGNALSRDVSGITTVQTVTAQTQQNAAASTETPADAPQGMSDFSGSFGGDTERPERTDGMMFESRSFNAPDMRTAETLPAQESGQDTLTALYDTAYAEYETWRAQLADADAAYRSAESEYRTCADELTACSTALNEAKSAVTDLEKEISSLQTSLSKARSNLSKLRSEYNSLKASYETDKLALEQTRDTDLAAYENAEYHYQITCATIEDELEEKQDAYDAAEENLRIFEENLSDGYIRAQQDGTISALNCQQGRSVNLNMAYVSYVDESSYAVTVELDQNDVTEVAIGDSVLIYSSESGTVNGKITAISAGTSESLADVRFNVTVTADEDAALYSGESVNIYFNAGDLNQSDFRDFDGGTEDREKSSSGGGRPDFGGEMPEGFDPSNMPDFRERKGE